MGPGRLTGMNDGMGSGPPPSTPCFNGARSIDRDERCWKCSGRGWTWPASMGPGRLTGMNALAVPWPGRNIRLLQWGPVD